jgi:hypothetical protein
VTSDQTLIEVKWGKAGPLDFSWFPKTFPKSKLLVICQTPFETKQVRGITPHEFLLNGWSEGFLHLKFQPLFNTKIRNNQTSARTA